MTVHDFIQSGLWVVAITTLGLGLACLKGAPNNRKSKPKKEKDET